jgi:hypothetical protein
MTRPDLSLPRLWCEVWCWWLSAHVHRTYATSPPILFLYPTRIWRTLNDMQAITATATSSHRALMSLVFWKV